MPRMPRMPRMPPVLRPAGRACSSTAATRAACDADPGCAAFGACQLACSDDACRDQCLVTYDASFTKFFAESACRGTLCPEACDRSKTADCRNCVLDSCSDDYIACQSNHDCKLLETCVGHCKPTGVDCFYACQKAQPEGMPLFTAWTLCTLDRCKSCSSITSLACRRPRRCVPAAWACPRAPSSAPQTTRGSGASWLRRSRGQPSRGAPDR